jgi:hypothetical protein
VVGVSRHTIRVEDETLDEFLGDVENKSEAVREALQLYRMQKAGVDDDRLTDTQRAAYQWLRERVGGDGRIQLEKAKPMLAQVLSLNADVIKDFVLRPLDRHGYIEVVPRMESVVVVVRPADAVDVPAGMQPVDDVEDATERLDALAEAGEGAAES